MGTSNEEVTEMEMANAQFHSACPAACALEVPQLVLAGWGADLRRLRPILIHNTTRPGIHLSYEEAAAQRSRFFVVL